MASCCSCSDMPVLPCDEIDMDDVNSGAVDHVG
jgi:hypothetical protein